MKPRGVSQTPAGGSQKVHLTAAKAPVSSLHERRMQRDAAMMPPKKEKLGDNVPSYQKLQMKYRKDVTRLGDDHEKLIETILEEEEQLIFEHNQSCKQTIKIVEEEMTILKDVDKPGSDVENYVEKLDKILERKIEMMTDLRRKVLDFYKSIKTEEQLAKLYQQLQEEQD